MPGGVKHPQKFDSIPKDAFARMRTSQPFTIFDSKQLYDAGALVWDDQETSGGSTSSSHDANRASVSISVGASTAGTRVRQTFRRFNYQPGKGQLIMCTFVMGAAESGITQRVGYFDENNGLFLELDDTTLSVVSRSNVTGTPSDAVKIAQSDWNMDKMDGAGPSGVTLDISKAQIFFVEFEWLGVGSVFFGFFIDGNPVRVHSIHNANSISSVYMSEPNLPIRFEISNDGTGGAKTLEHICSSVISDGGFEDTGVTTHVSTHASHVDANVAETVYAIVGIRLKSTHLCAHVDIKSFSVIAETGDDFEWMLIFNPTVAGSFVYSDESNSAVQSAAGATANTVTGGHHIEGGFVKASVSGGSVSGPLSSTVKLGSYIDGTPTTIVLCVRPLSINADIRGSMTISER